MERSLDEWPRERGVYVLRSRNLAAGVYVRGVDDGGFIGIREKLGSRYLFTEYFRRTAWPVRYLGRLPHDIALSETEPTETTTCRDCGKRARWTGPPAPAPWECESGCTDVFPVGAGMNQALFDYLDKLEL